MKKKNCYAFEPVDENVEIFEGTSHSLPHPVLVVQPKDELENCSFQIEVRNFIGSCIKVISGMNKALVFLFFYFVRFILVAHEINCK